MRSCHQKQLLQVAGERYSGMGFTFENDWTDTPLPSAQMEKKY
jgi:hypothetical protein